MTENGTYADALRNAIDAHRSSGMSAAQHLAQLTNYSYEHCRKVLGGLPVVSKGFNERVCRILGLDAYQMWRLAEREKRARQQRLDELADPVGIPMSLVRRWHSLNHFDRKVVERIVKALSEQRESHSLVDTSHEA